MDSYIKKIIIIFHACKQHQEKKKEELSERHEWKNDIYFQFKKSHDFHNMFREANFIIESTSNSKLLFKKTHKAFHFWSLEYTVKYEFSFSSD